MVGASQRLMEIRALLEQALEESDALGDTFLGIVIDTALQDVNARIDASKADE